MDVTAPVPHAIRSARLLLRPWRADDAPALLPVLEANASHLGPWIPPHVARAVPLAELAERLAGFADDFRADRAWRYAILTPDEANVLGEADLFPRAATGRVALPDADRVELGYWLASGVTGQGLATEATRALLDIANSLPGLTRAEIRCDPANLPSAAVPQRLGFTLDGIDGDVQVWSMPLTGYAVMHPHVVVVPRLATRRLLLREFQPADVEPYVALMADPDVTRFLGDGRPMNRADAWRQLAMLIGHWTLRGYGPWAVEERATGAFIGRIGCLEPEGYPGLEIAYTLARHAWGRGYAREGAAAALHWARTTLGRTGIVSIIRPDNAGSIRVAESLGAVRDGEIEFVGAPARLYRYPAEPKPSTEVAEY